MTDTVSTSAPHRRFNPLKANGFWSRRIAINARGRASRRRLSPENKQPYDPGCYLCPGNTRNSGATNPGYTGPYVFDNDFPALLADSPEGGTEGDPLFRAQNVRGTAGVICFSERHDLTLPELSVPEIRRVVDTWADQIEELGAVYDWVALFENKGTVMGCSQPHPHGQLWASDFLPNEVTRENENQARHHSETGRVMLVEYAAAESTKQERVVVENDTWIAVCHGGPPGRSRHWCCRNDTCCGCLT